ncbi:DUF1835 domain-containing protein [Lutibacter maritimus]|uniref:DUF1835 domain-containing protein n=1 Tax=Lutibacter maritimus TaxID=593133 RepID=A0A1I6RG35_9FLAO|nr:DUF1835 domain-containing protein [Lutibacter maritimus]SFS63693.1 protein of unknown function [Lutibacter maritimus]
MTNSIHVLNGDAILPIFQKSGIKGDIVICREMFCEGPILEQVASDDFWKQRYAFFEKYFSIGKLEYFDKTIKEILKIEDLAVYDEIVLWFEYDLFCQVNLLAMCSFLLQNYRKDVTYNLVCTGRVKGKTKLHSLSDFSSEEYVALYKNKVKLTKNNLIFADQAWKLYVQNNYKELSDFNFSKTGKFTYLQAAINQHLKRFPQENGFNEIENKILQIIASEALSSEKIVQKLLFWQNENTVYGFGDVQFFAYLKELNNFFFVDDEKYYLNENGKRKLLSNGL